MAKSDKVQEAMMFAQTAHLGQAHGQRDYFWGHLWHVHEYVVAAGFVEEDIRAAAWLHDVIEDTGTTIETIRERFGDRVADTVFAVTGEGEDRKERNTSMYRKIVAGTTDAAAVKLADRIANVVSCWANKDRRLFMYRDEYPEFRLKLKDTVGPDPRLDEMWSKLDELLGWKK